MSTTTAAPRRRSFGAVIVRKETASHYYLLLRAYRHWDFPKGEMEDNEDPLQTALREVQEETELTPQDLSFPWGHQFYETEPYRGGKVARYYLAQTSVTQIHLPISPELGQPEHDEWRWMSYTDAKPLLVPRLLSVLEWAERLVSAKG